MQFQILDCGEMKKIQILNEMNDILIVGKNFIGIQTNNNQMPMYRALLTHPWAFIFFRFSVASFMM